MSFYDQYAELKRMPFEEIWQSAAVADVEQVLQKDHLNERDLLMLLSPAAAAVLEAMAQKARRVTERHHHHEISLFAPMYVSDFCANHCVYCSFSITNAFARKKLTMEEVAREAKSIAETGIRSLLLLTGDSPLETPLAYIRECVEVLRNYFATVGIEINPLETDDYQVLVNAGVSGLTVFQEVYNEDIYKEIHLKGPKRNYRFRLDAPERGCQAGMRTVNIGALLGMDDWRREVFFTGMHTRYLQERYPDTTINLSLPRLRPYLGSYQPRSVVSDADFMQLLMAYRLFLPRSGLTLSTRESAEFRDQLVHLGITKMSAGVSTEVGGYSSEADESVAQFEISDDRSVSEICSMLQSKGLRAVL